MKHHDMLRTVYHKRSLVTLESSYTEMEQIVVSLLVKDYREAGIAESRIIELANEVQSSLTLESGPLLKALLIQGKEKDDLILVIHHLVVDGVSWRILIQDLEQGYHQYVSGKKISLPPKTAPFTLWSDQMREYAKSSSLQSELSYWESVVNHPRISIEVSDAAFPKPDW